MITNFTRRVNKSVIPQFSKTSQNKTIFQVRIVIATGWTVRLAKWIIDGTHVLFPLFLFPPPSHFYSQLQSMIDLLLLLSSLNNGGKSFLP